MDRIAAIKAYIEELFGFESDILKQVRLRSLANAIPQIHVPAHVLQLIKVIIQLKKPKRILEIGTLAGYSAIGIASVMPKDCHLYTIEINPDHVQMAQENVIAAGFGKQVTIIFGDAHEVIQQWLKERVEKFDMVFIDGNKESYGAYLSFIKPLLNDEAVLVTDNLIPKWKDILDPHPKDMMAKAIYSFNQQLSQDPQLMTAVTTTVVGNSPRIDALGISIFHPR